MSRHMALFQRGILLTIPAITGLDAPGGRAYIVLVSALTT